MKKCEKYADIPGAYSFLSIAIETHGAMNAEAYDFFQVLGRQISDVTGDDREVAFIFQRLSVLINNNNKPTIFKDSIQHSFQRRLLCTTTRTSDLFQTSLSFYLCF